VGRLAVEKGMTEEPFGTDEALVEGLKAGEQLAQLILVKRYGPPVKYLIKSISWDLAEEDAKEVGSDVFRRVIRGVRGFDPARGAFSTWLYRIVANATRDHVRKSKTLQARFEAAFESYERIVDDTGNEPGIVPAPLAEDRQAPVRLPVAHRIALDSLHRLTPTERKVLEAWATNLSNPEIGDLLGMSNQAVRTALSRAKAHLRDAFRELCRERGIDPDVLGP
jgi:RNA polymerase sigma-70 factor, ECF subfamily